MLVSLFPTKSQELDQVILFPINLKSEPRSEQVWSSSLVPFTPPTPFPTLLLGSSRELVKWSSHLGTSYVTANLQNLNSSNLILYVLKIFLCQYCSQFNYNN